VPQCAPADAEKGRLAVQRMTTTLARVSQQLGFRSKMWELKKWA